MSQSVMAAKVTLDSSQWGLAEGKSCVDCHVKEAIHGERAGTLQIHLEDAKDKSCIECHYNLVHRKVPDERVFKRDKWNAMVEGEFETEKSRRDDKIIKKDDKSKTIPQG